MTLRTRLRDIAARLPFVGDGVSRTGEPRDDGAAVEDRTDRTSERAAAVGEGGAESDVSLDDGSNLLPRPEQLVVVLKSNGGRLRQQEIIAETGWSSSTVSRHLRRLEDEGRIVRVLVKGEYLVLLPEADVSFGSIAPSSVTG